MSCKCADGIDAFLAERNTRIVYRFTLDQLRFGGPSLPEIRTEQIATGRGKPKAAPVLATFCPFCGKKYEKPTKAKKPKR